MTKASCDGSKSDCNKAIKEILKLENRWEELKRYVGISKLEDLQQNGKIDPNTYLTCDADWGFDMGMIWIRDFMAELESK
jgi:hypothetical protein